MKRWIHLLTALVLGGVFFAVRPALAQDATGNYLLAVDSGGSPDLEAYTFDSTTAGKLDSAFTSTTGTDPVGAIAIAAAP